TWSVPGFGSDLLQHLLAAGDLELAGGLDVERLHHAVVHHHREALAAHAEAARVEVELEPELLRVLGAAVGHEADLAVRLLVARPGSHHEGVVHGEAPDLVHALLAELVEGREIARHVLRRARGREGAGQAEDHDLLALRLLLHLERVRAHRAAVALDLDEFLDRALGKPVSDLDRHVALLFLGSLKKIRRPRMRRAGIRPGRARPRRTRRRACGSPSAAAAGPSSRAGP